MVSKSLKVKSILENMREYALKNNCTFNEEYASSTNETNFSFSEDNFILMCSIRWNEKIVFIVEDGEDDKEISFSEFIKFQEKFVS